MCAVAFLERRRYNIKWKNIDKMGSDFMKACLNKAGKFFLLIWDRVRRILSRLSPSSVWTRLGLSRILSRISVVYWICAFIVAGLIFFFCAQNGEDSADLSSGILVFLTKTFPFLGTVENAEYIIRKIGHFSIFALESILLSAAFYSTFSGRKATKRWLLSVLLVIAVLSEAVQFLAEDRGPTVKDVIIDFSGALLGFIGYTIFYIIRERRIAKLKKEESRGERVRIFEKSTKWLTASEFLNAEPINVFHREAETETPAHADEYKNYHMYARRAFRMGSHAERAELLITADDYYKLYINGVYVAQGPAPGYPNRYYVNRIDVLKYLRSGENVIAIDCYYQGLINRVWVSGDMRQGFICELHVDGKVVLRSDEHFHYMKPTSYIDKTETGYRTQFTEHFDLGNEPKGWKDIGFDDFMWTACFAKANTDYRFVWQETPVLDTEIVKPLSIEQNGNIVHVDFGKEISGVILSEFEGAKGKKVVLRMGEELIEGSKSVRYETRANCVYEHSFILDGDLNEWEMFDYAAFRYADFILEKGVRLVRAEARRQFYPLNEEKCVLDTTDNHLKAVFELCKNTIKTGVQEAYLDCPTREKGQYSGDLVITSLTHLYLSGDTRLLKKALDDWMASGEIAGGLMAVFPSAFMQEIADYSMLFPMVALRYFEHTGDIEYLKECYKAAERILKTYSKYARPDGLIENVTEAWNLVDWPQNLRDDYDFPLERPVGPGCHNVINAFYLGAVKYTEKIQEILGIQRKTQFEKLKESFNDAFFSMDTNLYVDAISSEHSAVHSNILPLFFEIVPEDKIEVISEYLIRRGMCTGVYMAYFYMKALAKAGKYKAVYDLIVSEEKTSWMNMIKEGATTLYEAWGKDMKWNTSLCHPWASAPVPVLIEDILGITPDVLKGGVWKQHLPLTVKHLKMTVPIMNAKVIFEREEDGTVLTIER